MQACHSCAYSTYTTELPGYTPGVCEQCSTYKAAEVVPYPTQTPEYKPASTSKYLAVTAGAVRNIEVAAGALAGVVALAAVAL